MDKKKYARNVPSLREARYCAGMGADLVGFNIAELSELEIQSIAGWLAGVDFCIIVDDKELDFKDLQKWADCKYFDFNGKICLSEMFLDEHIPLASKVFEDLAQYHVIDFALQTWEEAEEMFEKLS